MLSRGDYVKKKEIGNGQAKPRPCLEVKKKNWYLFTGKKIFGWTFESAACEMCWWDVLLQSVALEG